MFFALYNERFKLTYLSYLWYDIQIDIFVRNIAFLTASSSSFEYKYKFFSLKIKDINLKSLFIQTIKI